MSATLTGAWLGAVGGLGLLLVLGHLRLRRRPSLEERVAPYVQDAIAPSRLLVSSTGTASKRGWDRVLRRASAHLDGLLGGAQSIRLRLDELGEGTLEEVRLGQLVWGGTALGVVLGVGLLRAATATPPSPIPLLLVSLTAGIAGVLARDRMLSRRVLHRRQVLLAEFPTVAELLALSVAAGEGATGALDRVCRLCRGPLGRDLARTLAEARAGASLTHALQALADRSTIPVLRRFVDGVVTAIERGSPLAEVLRAQAGDVREAARRELIESAARREVLMMVPVVFLVLPVSVLFALFPGFYGLVLTI